MKDISREFSQRAFSKVVIPALATAVLVMATPVSPLLGAIILAGFYAGLLSMKANSKDSPTPQTT
jgi:hypothetical protein